MFSNYFLKKRTRQWPEYTEDDVKTKTKLIMSGPKFAKLVAITGGLTTNIFVLGNLTYLNLNSLTLREIPREIKHLVNLRTLIINFNNLSDLPSEIKHLCWLETLEISHNNLTSIPQEIGELKNLHTLNLECNNLADIPDLSENTHLKCINISSNTLSIFPQLSYQLLYSISEICLKDNRINKIPKQIKNLQFLKILDLENNLLPEIPAEVSLCPHLKKLLLRGNPIVDSRLYQLVRRSTTKQILKHLQKSIQTRSVVLLNDAVGSDYCIALNSSTSSDSNGAACLSSDRARVVTFNESTKVRMIDDGSDLDYLQRKLCDYCINHLGINPSCSITVINGISTVQLTVGQESFELEAEEEKENEAMTEIMIAALNRLGIEYQ